MDKLNKLLIFCFLFGFPQIAISCTCDGTTLTVNGEQTCFEVVNGSGGSWAAADKKCSNLGGFLAHIQEKELLTNLTSLISQNYKRPIMVGHIVGNAEYSLIAYMCPNNSYKDLMHNSVIDQTINGNSTDNATCLFIENSDYKLHYGKCTLNSDVLCEIPLESDSRCGVMRSCSSTSSISSKTTVSTRSASASKSSSNPLAITNANSLGSSKATSKLSLSNFSSKSNSISTNNNGSSPTVSTIANGSSASNNNNSSSQSNSNPTNRSPTNSNSNSSNNSNPTGPSTTSNSSVSNSNSNGGSNNGQGRSSNPLILANSDQNNPEGTFDKEETIPPTGLTGANSAFGSNGITQNPFNSTATTTFNPNGFHNVTSSQITGLSTLPTRKTTHSVSNASPTAEEILNMANDYNYPYGNDSLMDPLYNDTYLLYFDPNGNNGHGECYGRAYSRVGRWCVAWWIWLLVVLLVLAVLILFSGILCFFCGFNGLRRDHTNIVYIDQPPRTVFIDKPRPTVTTGGPPTILYDIAVSETIVPGYIVPPRPYYPTSPMMLLGPDDPYTNRSTSLGMIEEIRMDSPSNQITHENLAGSKLDLPGHSSPYDDRLPTGATSVMPPPIVQPESGNVPSMSDGLKDIDYNHQATNVPLKTFDDARHSAPGRSPTPSDEDFSDGIRQFDRNAKERKGIRFS